MVVAAFHRQRVLPLMARRQRLFEMTPGEPIDGIRLSAVALFDEEVLHHVREMVEGRQRSSDLTPFLMRLSWGYISLGMRDVRASSPPIPEDAERRAENRAHAEAYKERKDAKEARCKRKSLERDELEKRHRQQRHDGLLEEPSPSSSSMDSSSDDNESEAGQGPLDHLPDVREMAPEASASGLALPEGGGEGTSVLVIAHPEAKADTPETQASGKCAVSLMGSTAEVERATAGATQPPPQRAKGALESGEGWSVPADTGAVPLPLPPPLLRTRDAVRRLLCPRSSQKRQAEAPALVPRKTFKVSTSSPARWVVDVQATMQRGVVSARPNPKESVAQGEATEVATKQAGEGAPMPREAGALKLGEAKVPSIAEATEGEGEAPRTSEVEVAKAGASRAFKAEVADAEAPRTTEAEVAKARAPGTTEAEVVEAGLGATKPVAQDVEMEVGQASELEAGSLGKLMFLRWERDV
ncbi:uncharacterized protein [Miscanthus floridulus]|uniref:uncharacterized protein n=1 Tax=Miscanthus floridulus TaxID=154761 RepID=UPI00345B3616